MSELKLMKLWRCMVVLPGYKTGLLERDTLGVSSKETERVELARAADVCLRELVGIGSAGDCVK